MHMSMDKRLTNILFVYWQNAKGKERFTIFGDKSESKNHPAKKKLGVFDNLAVEGGKT